MSETFGARLRRLRNERGYSLVELATAVGAAEATIRQLETENVRSPSFLLGVRLADQLQVEPRFLALGEGTSVSARLEAIESRLAVLERTLRRRGKPAL